MTTSLKTLAKATGVPLSSIFGSGFLIIVPILAGAVGPYSVLAMFGVCVLAYLVGAVIRYNIKHVEPKLAGQPAKSTVSLERASDLALVVAYVISVCLYLHILAAFVLGGFGIDTPLNENILTTAIILFIVVVGIVKGLAVLGGLEQIGLYVTLAIVLLLFIGFGIYDVSAWQSTAGITLPSVPNNTLWQVLTIVGGTLIVVQGFETPRYLGGAFEADVRVSASRWSQIISTVVYVIFVALALPMVHTLNGQYDDNSLIKLAATASGLLVVPLIFAAALSQFSAAVADTLTATGNMKEITHGELEVKWANLLVGGGAILLSWSANTLEILAIASRAFAFYYLVQCFVAVSVTQSPAKRFGFLLLATVLGFITLFAVPAG